MRILFFAPHAGIWIHSFTEALLADALIKGGHEVQYLTCGTLYQSGCVVMRGYGVKPGDSDEAKRKACRECLKVKKTVRSSFGFKGSDFDAYVTEQDWQYARELIDSVTSFDKLYGLVIDGIHLGKLASYEFFVEKKKSSFDFDDKDIKEYKDALRNVIVTYRAAARYLNDFKPECVVVYVAEYSVNGVWGELCRARGIRFYSLLANVNLAHRLDRILVCRNSNYDATQSAIANWPKWKDMPVLPDEARQITDHLLSVIGANSIFAYSNPKRKEIFHARKFFGVAPRQKLFLATLSSRDEILGAEMIGQIKPEHIAKMAFKSQDDWIRAMLDFFAKHPDYFLVVRVHPREFPNRRDGVQAQYVTTLKKLLSDLPPNVRVNWPTDNLSLYDIMEEVDVFLNGWSTTGKEMSHLGLPVITYCRPILHYLPDLMIPAATPEQYFDEAVKALSTPFDFERIRRAYRWQAWEFVRMSLEITDAFRHDELKKPGILYRGLNKLTRRGLMRAQLRLRALLRPRKLKAADTLLEFLERDDAYSVADVFRFQGAVPSRAEETSLIKAELKKIYFGLYGTHEADASAEPYALRRKLYNCIHGPDRSAAAQAPLEENAF